MSEIERYIYVVLGPLALPLLLGEQIRKTTKKCILFTYLALIFHKTFSLPAYFELSRSSPNFFRSQQFRKFERRMKSILSAFATLRRGGKMKNAKGKGKKGVKGKKEMYDLIVNIDLAEWRLTVEQVFFFF